MANFRVFKPEDVEPLLRETAGPSTEVLFPTIITTEDDKVLMVGDKLAGNRRFPTATLQLSLNQDSLTPFWQTFQLLESLFQDISGQQNPDEYNFLGLVKDNKRMDRLIAPVLVDLDYMSDDPRLTINERWSLISPEHSLGYWISLDDLPNLVENAGKKTLGHRISRSGGVMISHYLKNDTYLDFSEPTNTTSN